MSDKENKMEMPDVDDMEEMEDFEEGKTQEELIDQLAAEFSLMEASFRKLQDLVFSELSSLENNNVVIKVKKRTEHVMEQMQLVKNTLDYLL